MPAFQLTNYSAALVSDSGTTPSVHIVGTANPGIVVHGHDALRQLIAACQLALDAAEHESAVKRNPK